jgi:hypothetical protein
LRTELRVRADSQIPSITDWFVNVNYPHSLTYNVTEVV